MGSGEYDPVGLVKFDGINWIVYNTSNSGLPGNNIRSLVLDESGNKRIGTYGGGLARFSDTTWTVYSTSNSGLPQDYVISLAIDRGGNIWIGTGKGLTVYHEPGIVPTPNPRVFVLYQNYPNPFNSNTIIEFSIPKAEFVTLKIYNLVGQAITTLISCELNPGEYNYQWQADKLPSNIFYGILAAGDYRAVRNLILVK